MNEFRQASCGCVVQTASAKVIRPCPTGALWVNLEEQAEQLEHDCWANLGSGHAKTIHAEESAKRIREGRQQHFQEAGEQIGARSYAALKARLEDEAEAAPAGA